MNADKIWTPRDTPNDKSILFDPLLFPFLAEEAELDPFRPVFGVNLLVALFESDSFVAGFLRQRMFTASSWLSKRWKTRTYRQR